MMKKKDLIKLFDRYNVKFELQDAHGIYSPFTYLHLSNKLADDIIKLTK